MTPRLHLLLAIQRAREAGLKHWAAALVALYKLEYLNK